MTKAVDVGKKSSLERSASIHSLHPAARRPIVGERLPVALVDPRSLTREALLLLLYRSNRFHVRSMSTVAELLAEHNLAAATEMVLLNLGSASLHDPVISRDINTLMQARLRAPVVLISENNDYENVEEALDRGIRGYILTTQTPRALFRAIRLVHEGGTFIPDHDLSQAPSVPRDVIAPDGEPIDLHRLTPRQRQVFNLVRQGKPNKIIAHELSMQESTVKVHVRQVLRKMQANNRTQVAFLASRCAGATG